MVDWSLSTLLSQLHNDIEQQLSFARKAMEHPVAKGDASEATWLKLLKAYLPERYKADKAFVVDSEGRFSEQIDIVVYDRQYSPFIFTFNDQIFIPAESVYAVFEAKQELSADIIRYAQNKATSVRKLKRTSLPIPHAGGTYPAKIPMPIIGGVLAFESGWTPSFGPALDKALKANNTEGLLNLGCVAAHGHFYFDPTAQAYLYRSEGKAATAFLFKLIAMLQMCGTVPMIDIDAYANWLIPNTQLQAS